MMTFPNILSLLRLPLAFFFLNQDVYVRAFALITAMTTDFFDGFLARRYRICSQFGATLDPITDKFFVVFTLTIFIIENKLNWLFALTMLSRDFSVFLFGIYLFFKGTLGKYEFRAIWCGKITTTLQLFVLFALTFNVEIPLFIYAIFVVLGGLSLGELYLFNRSEAVKKT